MNILKTVTQWKSLSHADFVISYKGKKVFGLSIKLKDL